MASQSPLSPSTGPTTEQPHSCVICQRRKVKCERKLPCSNCVKHGAFCEFRAPVPPRRRKRQSSDPDVHAKLKRAEVLLQGYGIDPDDLNKGHFDTKQIEVKAEAATTGIHEGADALGSKPVANQRPKCNLQRYEKFLDILCPGWASDLRVSRGIGCLA